MGEINFNNKVINSTKWSALTEVISRLVGPIINMILARIIAPDAFGVVVTVTMIISFADMLSSAGFQKYLIQHEFKDNEEKFKHTNVAFISNIAISLFLWGTIILFSEQIAVMVGNPGLGNVIAIASIQLPLTAFSSIQMALYRRDFDYKTLFIVKMVAICIPVVITIPLALLGLSYWSLIVGTISMHIFNAAILTIKSKWKPKWLYDIGILKEMFSFSIWSLIESISIWLTLWVDVFIIGSFLNEYYLGLYKTSTTMVNALMALVTASVIPILFSTLSRLQNDETEFKHMFYRYQRIVAYLILPMGFGVFLYSDFATSMMLGNQWYQAGGIIGIWALTSSLVITTSHFNSEVYRSKGKPQISFISQLISLSIIIPACLISINYGFWALVYTRALIRLESIATGFIIMKTYMNFQVMQTINNISKPFIFTLVMCLIGILLKQLADSVYWIIISIFICATVYIVLILLFAKEDINIAKRVVKRIR
ncbi:lipopolysaccharide biosynthesis protein [Sporosarcina gallistercoris]|uniref:Lipopolysaccharide biosynthesis protein n=1 Tax=Sporosarcina gallistercoris TaxID=2762245 RepID=A0ABR8PMM6_9BACL|nr:lipopolysaccharide biosynthesis protein [Sporosarcina gallistercoris]MBD7909421.1 lipopolysaccharide biosynthesis protein [Sporosarcina gallistercoris]